jgi:thiol:disulfide interchange protein DsbD
LTFDGVIEKRLHLYSQFTPDGGPLALEVVLKPKGNLIL